MYRPMGWVYLTPLGAVSSTERSEDILRAVCVLKSWYCLCGLEAGGSRGEALKRVMYEEDFEWAIEDNAALRKEE